MTGVQLDLDKIWPAPYTAYVRLQISLILTLIFNPLLTSSSIAAGGDAVSIAQRIGNMLSGIRRAPSTNIETTRLGLHMIQLHLNLCLEASGGHFNDEVAGILREATRNAVQPYLTSERPDAESALFLTFVREGELWSILEQSDKDKIDAQYGVIGRRASQTLAIAKEWVAKFGRSANEDGALAIMSGRPARVSAQLRPSRHAHQTTPTIEEWLHKISAGLTDQSASVRAHAARAFQAAAKTADSKSYSQFLSIYDFHLESTDPEVSGPIAGSLGIIALLGGKEYAEEILLRFKAGLNNPNPKIQIATAHCFGGVASALGIEHGGRDYSRELIELFDLSVEKTQPEGSMSVATDLGFLAEALGLAGIPKIKAYYDAGLANDNYWRKFDAAHALLGIARAWKHDNVPMLVEMCKAGLDRTEENIQEIITMDLEGIARVWQQSHNAEMIDLCQYVIRHGDEAAVVTLRDDLPHIAEILDPRDPGKIIREIDPQD